MHIDLHRQLKCHVISLSENTFGRNLRKYKLKCFWSVPVPPFRETITTIEVITSLSCRPARLTPPSTWIASPRFLHSIVAFGDSHVQVVVLYCKPLNHSDPRDFNNHLMQMGVQQTRLVKLPVIIMGDLNMPVHEFAAWPLLQSEGFDYLQSMYQKKYQQPMPCSCMEVTNHPDTAIFSQSLLPLLDSIQVLDGSWLATHKPVIFTLNVPRNGLFTRHFRYPKQFVTLGIEDLHSAAIAAEPFLGATRTNEDIGDMIEDVLDVAVSENSHILCFNQLPAAFGGRCKPQSPKSFPVHLAIRPGRPGDFEPSVEVMTMTMRRQVKQVRRVQPLDVTPATMQELVTEWQVICKCSAFEDLPFLQWVWRFPELGPAWLHDVLQLMKHQVEMSLKNQAKPWERKLAYLRQLDATEGHSKMAYKTIRGQTKPPVLEVKNSVEGTFLVSPTAEPGHFDLYGDNVRLFDTGFPIKIDDHIFQLCEIDEYSLRICSTDWHHLPEQVVASQIQYFQSPKQIAHSLNQFWNPIWQ